MVVTDIVNHSREFRRTHGILYPFGFGLAGIVMAFARYYSLSLDTIVQHLATTYPSFMVALSYAVLGSIFKTVGAFVVCMSCMVLVIFAATRHSPTPFIVAYFSQTFVALRSLPRIYLFALAICGLDALTCFMFSSVTGKGIDGFIVNERSTSVLNLFSYISNNMLECWFIFSSMFCFARQPGSPPLKVGSFAVSSLFNRQTDLVYTGCKYYGFLFGCIQYLGYFFHLDLWLVSSPVALAYIVSMFLLANGLSFNPQDK